jgi:hypothetical protein
MKLKNKLGLSALSVWILSVAAMNASADNPFADEPGMDELLTNLMQFLLKILSVLGIIAFGVCGIFYLTSAGDAEKAKTAKQMLTFSVIGLVIAISSLMIIFIIQGLLNG